MTPSKITPSQLQLPSISDEELHGSINLNEDVITSAALTDDEIVASVTETTDDSPQKEDDDVDTTDAPVPGKQASEAADLLTKYFENCKNITPNTFAMLTKISSCTNVHYIKNKKKTDFFGHQ